MLLANSNAIFVTHKFSAVKKTFIINKYIA